ncbi:NTH1 [Candida oxycetoniae]|uniref:Trehalase n=1 Tax=Candida oxycetoniae TaxID=497107 RepID=A0AAI9SWB9_9ASCO|nr:NTH1 [Candida oxycetoniae]KAI3404074.1 NTH1 [Candida oxycetoniae]
MEPLPTDQDQQKTKAARPSSSLEESPSESPTSTPVSYFPEPSPLPANTLDATNAEINSNSNSNSNSNLSFSAQGHRRQSSVNSSDDDPYALAEKYYGDYKKKILNKNSPLARVRTFSTFESKMSRIDFMKQLNEEHPIVSSINEAPEPHSDLSSRSPSPPKSTQAQAQAQEPATATATATATAPASKIPPFRQGVGQVNFNFHVGKDDDHSHSDGDDESGEPEKLNRPNYIPLVREVSPDAEYSSSDLDDTTPLQKTNDDSFQNRVTKTKLKKRPSIVPIYEHADASADSMPMKTKDQMLYRRASMDDTIIRPKKYYISDVQDTLRELLANEDTDNNCQITIEDTGPKVLRLGTANSNGYKQASVRGTYMLSNLLQELTIASRFGRHQIVLDEARINENPVARMKRLITTSFWKNLTRRVTSENIVDMARDTKIKEYWFDENGVKHESQESHRIYIPYNRKDQYDYFSRIKNLRDDIKLDVQYLPKIIDADYIESINNKPGILALSSRSNPDDPENPISWPYVVPGGRFNELYGWDSYMETLGLLTDVKPNQNLDHLELARGMCENFIYEIEYYGKILNANRSYYLGRSQPPFLTDMALRTFNKTIEVDPGSMNDAIDFLRRATLSAIKEYETVWCAPPRLDSKTGLSCYHPSGKGVPPETEASHFDAVLKPYIDKYKLSQAEFIAQYNDDEIVEPELDEYFMHDRAVRESGHDTSYRLEGKCAYLATVDLNSLLYKYENDIAFLLTTFFQDRLEDSTGRLHSSNTWIERAKKRKQNVDKYLWNEKDCIYYDYNVHEEKQTDYESATAFWPLYSKLASDEQAAKLVEVSLPKFEEHGGLVAGTLKSRGEVGLTRPSRQWDYPFGWAPQQILAWIGLTNYGYHGIARRLAYRWLFMMTKSFVDYNGVVVEKYNVTKGAVSHRVDAEYGNQGLDFKGVATEGFGWVNASYLLGLTFLDLYAHRALGTVTPPDVFLKNLHPNQRKGYQ